MVLGNIEYKSFTIITIIIFDKIMNGLAEQDKWCICIFSKREPRILILEKENFVTFCVN